MTLLELQIRIDDAIDHAMELGEDPAKIGVTLQINMSKDGSVWSDKEVELHYDGGVQCSGCVIEATFHQEGALTAPPTIKNTTRIRRKPMKSGMANGTTPTCSAACGRWSASGKGIARRCDPSSRTMVPATRTGLARKSPPKLFPRTVNYRTPTHHSMNPTRPLPPRIDYRTPEADAEDARKRQADIAKRESGTALANGRAIVNAAESPTESKP